MYTTNGAPAAAHLLWKRSHPSRLRLAPIHLQLGIDKNSVGASRTTGCALAMPWRCPSPTSPNYPHPLPATRRFTTRLVVESVRQGSQTVPALPELRAHISSKKQIDQLLQGSEAHSVGWQTTRQFPARPRQQQTGILSSGTWQAAQQLQLMSMLQPMKCSHCCRTAPVDHT